MSGAVSYKMIGLSDFGRWDNAWLPGASVGLFALRWNPNVIEDHASQRAQFQWKHEGQSGRGHDPVREDERQRMLGA